MQLIRAYILHDGETVHDLISQIQLKGVTTVKAGHTFGMDYDGIVLIVGGQ